MKTESRRSVACEVRATGEGKTLRLSGYAALYGQKSRPIQGRKGPFIEVIQPKAFDGILTTDPDVKLTLDHDAMHTVSRTSAGTLALHSDSKGLHFDAQLPDTQEARDLHENVRVGNLSECSFIFSNPTCTYSDTTDEQGNVMPLRTIHDFDSGSLSDISIVGQGAYPNTEVSARSKRDAADEDDETIEDADEDMWDLFGPPFDENELDRAHVGNGDCASRSCPCNNRMLTLKKRGETFEESLLRAKRVGSEDLTADAFAAVGDPDDTSTWKLPIRGDHAKASLLRFAHTTGLGAKRAEALDKILAAVKRMAVPEPEMTRSQDSDGDDAAIARRRHLLMVLS